MGSRHRPELARAVGFSCHRVSDGHSSPAFSAYTVIETIFKSFTVCFPFKRFIMMAGRTPEWTRALVIKKCPAEGKPVYHDAVLEKRPLQQLKHGEVLVKMSAVSFNRREVSVCHCYGEEHQVVAHPNTLIALDTPWSIPRNQVWEHLWR